MSSCVFCGIVAGTVPAAVVAEDDGFLAFRDINPVAPVHLLVIPKTHVVSAADAEDEALMGGIVGFARRVAAAEGLSDGWRLVTNVGRDGGQTVFHLHLHVIGGRRMGWPPG